jgi:hypothetical protein
MRNREAEMASLQKDPLAQPHPLMVAIPKFIQLGGEALLPLKPMGQSRRGVIQAMEAQVHRAAKACLVE